MSLLIDNSKTLKWTCTNNCVHHTLHSFTLQHISLLMDYSKTLKWTCTNNCVHHTVHSFTLKYISFLMDYSKTLKWTCTNNCVHHTVHSSTLQHMSLLMDNSKTLKWLRFTLPSLHSHSDSSCSTSITTLPHISCKVSRKSKQNCAWRALIVALSHDQPRALYIT